MSEVGGLLKHEKTQHALVGLGCAALAAAVAGGPNFPKGTIKCVKKKKKNLDRNCVVTYDTRFHWLLDTTLPCENEAGRVTYRQQEHSKIQPVYP